MIDSIVKNMQTLKAEWDAVTTEDMREKLINRWNDEWNSACSAIHQQIKEAFDEDNPPKQVLTSRFTEEKINQLEQDWPENVDYFDESAWDTYCCFNGKKWTDVHITNESGNLTMALTHLSEEAFQYYLPAFMSNALLDDNMGKIPIPLGCFHKELCISRSDEIRKRFFFGMGQKKSQAIAAFLKLIELFGWIESSDTALQEYWNRFLP